MSRRAIALLLGLIMMVGLLPHAAFADSGDMLKNAWLQAEGETLLCRFPGGDAAVFAEDGTEIPADEEGIYHLSPGSYYLSTAADGAEAARQRFVITADGGDSEFHITMLPSDEPEKEKSEEKTEEKAEAEAEPDETSEDADVIEPSGKIYAGGVLGARYSKYQVFDVQRSPSYPKGTQTLPQPFTVSELNAPDDLDPLGEKDYFYFVGLGPASETGLVVSEKWNCESEELDPYTVALHYVSERGDAELGWGVIGAFSAKGFFFESDGKGFWFSNTAGYYYGSTDISYTPLVGGRVVCDSKLLAECAVKSMLKPASDTSMHRHVWGAASDDTDTVAFFCKAADCPYGADKVFSIVLSVPDFVLCGSEEHAVLELSEKESKWPAELQRDLIYYVGRGDTDYPESLDFPTAPGSYTAKASVGYRKDPQLLTKNFAVVSEPPTPFSQSKTAGGIVVTVSAEAGVFPADSVLTVEEFSADQIQDALKAARGDAKNVIASESLRICVLDRDGNVRCPADGHEIKVSLSLAEAADENLNTCIYRLVPDKKAGALSAEVQAVSEGGASAAVDTDGIMLYTLELVTPTGSYVFGEDRSVLLSDILEEAGLSGPAGKLELSDPELFRVSGTAGARQISALRAFSGSEWIRVGIRNLNYEITLTDGSAAAVCLRRGGHIWAYGLDPVICRVCGELKAVADGGSYDMEFDGDRWIRLGNPKADAEDYTVWEAMFKDTELSGIWAEDLLTIAVSQLDYEESKANYAMNRSRDRNGYTRYGAWYGIPYGEWCAMFVSFCLHYAGIEDEYMPYNAGCEAWVDTLQERSLFEDAPDFRPEAGDLIFYDNDGDGKPDHVGIVSAYYGDSGLIRTIEGNLADKVSSAELDCHDERIFGYGLLPVDKKDAERLRALGAA